MITEIKYLADFRRNMDSYSEFRKKSMPLRILLEMITSSKMDIELQQEFPKNLALVERAIKNHEWEQTPWSKIIHAAISYSEKYHFFHWELEFPDAYTDVRRGFDLVIMNPPWDAVKPEDDDFFSFYYPAFRKMKSKPEKNKVERTLLQNETTQAAFIEYTNSILRRVAFYKSPGQYLKRGGGDTDMWKLFLERGLSILSENGTLSIVIPYGIITNEGAKELRISVLNKNLRYLYEFENLKGIFPDVHRSYKFVLLVVDNEKPLRNFPAAFYLHDIGALEERQVEKRKFVEISRDFIKLLSPFSLSIPEIRDSKELIILEKLCRNHRLLHYGLENSQSETWTIGFVTEMHRTGSSHLFRTDGKGWPLTEGKNFHQFIPSYERTDFTISPEEGLKWTSKIREFGNLNREFHNVVRLAFRDVASSTNVRTMISCIIPRHSFLPHTAPIIVPKLIGKLLLDERYHRIIAYLAGIFNSTVFDFLIRRRITTHLSYFFLEQTPIPYKLNDTFQEITKISGRLSSVDERFKDLAKAVGVEYGPMKMEERIELTANLDALVCCSYGLNRQEYEYILDTFDAFEEDEKLKNIGEQYEWNDAMIRKLNGEVKKMAIYYYDKITEKVKLR